VWTVEREPGDARDRRGGSAAMITLCEQLVVLLRAPGADLRTGSPIKLR